MIFLVLAPISASLISQWYQIKGHLKKYWDTYYDESMFYTKLNSIQEDIYIYLD